MSRPGDEALEVLRAVWSAQGQDLDASADPGEVPDAGKTCQKMRDVGFDGLAGADGDLRAAWRETLRRDGKLRPAAGSIADLLLGPAETR